MQLFHCFILCTYLPIADHLTLKGFDKIFESDIIIVGLYPPPPGGIGVHIERIAYHLKRENLKFHVFNHGYFRDNHVTPTNKSYLWWMKFFIFTLIKRKKIRISRILFHFHVFSFLHYPFLFLLSRLITDNIMLTIHNENFFLYPSIKKLTFHYLIKKISCKKIICVSKKINDILTLKSVNSMFLNAYIFIPYQQKIIEKDKYFTYVAMNMWRFNKEQIYRYGTDLVFKLMRDNPDKYKLHIYVSDKNKSVNIISLMNEFEFLENIKNNINILFGRNLVEYIGNYDFFIRPNRSDGFGVSILEALNSRIPVIASDTCIRPEGCITFVSGDYASFTQQINLIDEHKKETTFPQNNSNRKILVKMYKEFIN